MPVENRPALFLSSVFMPPAHMPIQNRFRRRQRRLKPLREAATSRPPGILPSSESKAYLTVIKNCTNQGESRIPYRKGTCRIHRPPSGFTKKRETSL